ncbi:hypothetical protein EOD40_09305 [Flavobacterium sufflavum]|uniref:Uncharacterized protein n=1 Tax=Flavobacterium sufflavum TaxID=1921138 RepID=A0A3S2V4U7_9FLAO|nr:hypothetical protein [Flavobacterium sufflavum]RVT76686.1 hypothetical protein EOD40_09305 [Flavobacterium sufflavum]
MEIDNLKSDWKAIRPIPKSEETLLLMLQENTHPVLKSIRKQIVIEVTAWSLFLMLYYSMFDGATKSFWVNLVLIIALLMPIFHSFYGYHYNKYLADGSNVKMALEQLYNRLKKYALIAIIARVGFVSGLLLFFCYNIHFTTTKYFLLSLILLVFLIQLFALYQIWVKRLNTLKSVIITFFDSE